MSGFALKRDAGEEGSEDKWRERREDYKEKKG